MPARVYLTEAICPADAPQALHAAMEAAIRRREADAAGDPRLLRVEIPVVGLMPLDWLRAQTGVTQYYWSDRDGAFAMAGIGEADVVVPHGPTDLPALFRYMRSRLNPEHAGLRFYGGFRFHDGPVKGERWKAFRAYRFIVPRIEVVRRDSTTWLCCNAKAAHPRTNARTLDALAAELKTVQFPESAPPERLPRFGSRTDVPDASTWNGMVEQLLRAIGKGLLEKAVLARETTYQADGPIDAVTLLARAVRQAPRSYEFCFHPADDRAFVGVSPERLFRRIGLQLESEALAGTRPRGKSDAADHALALELSRSEKDRHEHQIVVDALRALLTPLCRELHVAPEAKILRLRHVQHLCTAMEGTLREDEADVDAALIGSLHPTPAVGGSPRADALAWIEAHEPFDRGIFAAPVGWVGHDGAEFCVALRCALVQGSRVSLYNGAGIVEGSLPEEEWAELESKMANFRTVLQ